MPRSSLSQLRTIFFFFLSLAKLSPAREPHEERAQRILLTKWLTIPRAPHLNFPLNHVFPANDIFFFYSFLLGSSSLLQICVRFSHTQAGKLARVRKKKKKKTEREKKKFLVFCLPTRPHPLGSLKKLENVPRRPFDKIFKTVPWLSELSTYEWKGGGSDITF